MPLYSGPAAAPVSLSSAAPWGCGVASSGSGSSAAREDHVHGPAPFGDTYNDGGQTIGIQTITLRSVPVPINSWYDIDVVIIGLTSALNQAARVSISCAMGRGAGSVFRSGTPLATLVSGIGGIVANIAANTGTQSADITITGGAATTTNWKCWTTVRRNG